MLSPGNMLVKRARMARHAHREVPNVLKARFSPTAVWHSQTDDEETDAPTLPAIIGPLAPTRETSKYLSYSENSFPVPFLIGNSDLGGVNHSGHDTIHVEP